MNKIILYLYVFGLTNAVSGQELLFNSNYNYNKQLYNPAFLCESDLSSINIINSRKWLGINDAPVIYYFNTQYTVNKNFNLGVNISNGESALLNSFNGSLSGSYAVEISDNQQITFGLSFGSYFNRLDLSGAENFDLDPILINSNGSSHSFEGRFGVVYKLKNLRIGFSLPQLLGPNSYLDERISFSPFDVAILSLDYDYKFNNPNYSIKPLLVYNYTGIDEYEDIWEAGAFFNFNQLLELGASYKSIGALSAHLRLIINDRFIVRYSYDFPQMNQKGISNGSHEIHLGYLLNKSNNKRQSKHRVSEAPPIRSSDLRDPSKVKYQNEDNIGGGNDIDIKKIKKYEGPDPDFFEMDKGFYLVIGEEDKANKAEKILKKAQEKGLTGEIGYSTTVSKHIIFLDSFEKLQQILDAYQKQNTSLGDLSIIEVY